MHNSQAAIDYAALQIAKIDSGERNVFLQNINTLNQVIFEILGEGTYDGVFSACIFEDNLRIHIACNEDTDIYNHEICDLINEALHKSTKTSPIIWIWNDNRRIIGYIKQTFNTITGGKHDYASIEFIMRREKHISNGKQSLIIRPYEPEHIDEYLMLLDEAMTFVSPPPNFRGNKDGCMTQFKDRNDVQSFEAFWKNDELIGLYWRKNAEIDIMAVSTKHQRKGYGNIILNRAIDMVFENTDEEYAYLYAVDWNEQGQAFYKKYGMEVNGHSYLLQISVEGEIS